MALPSGYTQLEYIGASGSQYLNIDFKPDNNSRVVIETDMPRLTTSSTYYLYGARVSSSSKIFGFSTYSNNFRQGYNNSQTNFYSSNITGKYTVDQNKNVITITQNGVQLATKTATAATYTPNLNMFIFAVNNNGSVSNQAKCNVYSCKVYDNGTLVRDLIPAKNSSGTLGMYDVANNQFYTNAGSGTFTAGPVAASYLYYSTAHGTAPSDKEIDVPYTLLSSDLPTLTASGYAFDGWYKDSGFSNKANAGNILNATTTLYAKWLDKFSISYVTKHGTTPTTKLVDPPAYSLVASDLPILSASGYVFDGWYRDSGFTTKMKVDDVIYDSIILYGKWLEKITIHYEAKYGTAPADLIKDPPSYTLTAADLPTIKVVGFKATEWYYNDTFTSKANAGDSIVTDTTLYAKFEETEIIVDGKRKIEMKVKLNNTEQATESDYDTLHPITDADLVEYTKNGTVSDIGTVLTASADNMENISATATDIESRQHGMFLIAKDVEIPNSAWKSNSTYEDYPFRASITVAGCNANYVPDVYFDVEDINLDIFAPISETGNSVVYIYAKEKPGKTITVPTIKLATEASKISTVKVLGAISVDTKPTKLEYEVGETISYSGMRVKAYYSNGSVATITNYNVTPASGTILSEGEVTCTVSYTEDGVTKTDSFKVTVSKAGPTIKTFSECTDVEFLAIAQALQDGTITTGDLPWNVGDTRNVSLGAFTSYPGGSATTQVVQTAQLVILHRGSANKQFTDGESVNFIIGFKDNVAYSYAISSSATDNNYSTSLLWQVEDNIYNALPSDIKRAFKQFKATTLISSTSQQVTTYSRYLSSPAVAEVFDEKGYCWSIEFDAFPSGSRFEYYKTLTNIAHSTSKSDYWWMRSPSGGVGSPSDKKYVCQVDSSSLDHLPNTCHIGTSDAGISPFGCI